MCDQSRDVIIARNKLALRKIILYENFFGLMKSLDESMAELFYQLSRAKTQSKLNYSNPDDAKYDLEPSIFINIESLEQNASIGVDEIKFTIQEDSKLDEEALRNRTSKKADNQENAATKKAFKPFGLLEPQSAKIARKVSTNLISFAIELVNIRLELKDVEEKLKNELT